MGSVDGRVLQEAREIHEAHAVLQRWIAQRFITVFFETVDMDDPDRREFWLRYAPHVTRFRIYGDSNTRRRLSEDARLRPFLPGRFCLGTAANGSNALMMRVKDRTVIEFGDTGNACYVYHADAPQSPTFEECIAPSGLRRKSMPWLFRYTGTAIKDLREEGRFTHHEGWQTRASKWIQYYLSI